MKGLKHMSHMAERFKETRPGLVLYSVTLTHQRFNMFKSFSLQESLQGCNSLNVWHVPDPDGIFMFHRTVFFVAANIGKAFPSVDKTDGLSQTC